MRPPSVEGADGSGRAVAGSDDEPPGGEEATPDGDEATPDVSGAGLVVACDDAAPDAAVAEEPGSG